MDGFHFSRSRPVLDVEQYRAIIDNTPFIIYSLDKHGVVTLFEGLGLRKLGYSPGELVGQSALEIYRDYPDIVAAIGRSLAGEAVFFTHRVGENFFDNRMVPFSGADGKVQGIAGAAIDISEFKKNEARLLEKDRHLQKSYNELASLHEELIATEEELRVQYDEILRTHHQVMRQNTLLATLEETTFSLLNKLDMDQLLRTIVMRAAYIVDAEDAFISLPSADGNHLEVRAGLGIYNEAIRSIPLEYGLMGRVYASGQAELIENYANWEGRPAIPALKKICALFAVPLYAKQEVAGVLGVAFRQAGQKFDSNQTELLKRFAELASLALQNAALHANLQNELDERVKSETTLYEIFNGVNEAILVHDPETGGILWVNRGATEVFGYTAEELKRLGMAAISRPENLQEAFASIRRAVQEGPRIYERETVDKHGRPLIVEVNVKRAQIHGKVCCLAVLRDITGRKQMEKDLFKTETEKQAVLDALPDTMLIFGQDGCLQEYKKTPDFEAIFPTENKAIGMNITEMLLPEEVARTYLHCIGQTLATGKLQLYEYTLHIRGVKRYREVRFTRISADSVLALLRDITEMRLSQEQVKFLRRHDSMTGVYDRTYFEREVSRAGDRNIGGTAVVMCDVDGLKLINDTLGHAAGDDVLRVVASALSKTFTAGQDIVARIGGDEFAVITYRMDKASIEAAIDQFMGMITYYSLSNPQLPVSVSVGWAADFGDGADIDALLKEADNAMYRQKMHQSQSMRNAIVQTMMKALEARDYITEGHADRLQALVERIGKDLRLSGARLADLLLFAQFHDIGKVGIPDHILNKPGKLTDEEFAMMKQHSDIGYRIALASPDLAPIAGLILRHHEWWNGNGYPLGLKGSEIPLECRILALADAYDAMTSDRPYRKAWTQEAALSEILRCRGSQFDPNLADLFVGLISGGNCPKREQNFRQTKKR